MAIYFAKILGKRITERKFNADRKKYVNSERKWKVLKKVLRIRQRKEAKESVLKELEENLLAKNWKSLFLSDLTKDVVKVFGCHENLL